MMNIATEKEEHLSCFACGRKNDHGLRLHFIQETDGSVAAEFLCDEAFQGYEGTIHGGITATILDSAMTNCLLMKGVTARTARLNIRYHDRVVTGRAGRVVTVLKRKIRNAYLLNAWFYQGERLCAEARAVFIKTGDNGKSKDTPGRLESP
ncbi:MAG: PaaI family thioesterase [Vulcanimicrobiota bacterium]